jgi:hypothetical protein
MGKDKNTIINEMINNTADVMEAKADYNECVAEQMEQKGKVETAERLREMNKRIMGAVALIRENAGCWA